MAEALKEQGKISKRFTYDELLHAISQTGLGKGDTVITYCSLLKLGRPVLDGRDFERFFLDAIFEVIGDDGLLVLPSLSYTFCKREVYDPQTSLSDVNVLSNYCMLHGCGVRSLDPNFSNIFLTKSDLNHTEPSTLAKEIRSLKFSNVSFDYDEEHSLPRFLIDRKARYLNLSHVPYITLLHNVEQQIKVPTRYYKLFKGSIKTSSTLLENVKIYYFCRQYFTNTEIEMYKLDDYFKHLESTTNNAQIKRAPLGKASILGGDIAGILECFKETFLKDPYAICKGPALTQEQLDSLYDPDAVTESDIERVYYQVHDLSTK